MFFICYITIALVCFITCFYGQLSIVSPGLLLSLSSISVIICYITIALVCFITCFYGQPSIVSPGLLLSLSSISVITCYITVLESALSLASALYSKSWFTVIFQFYKCFHLLYNIISLVCFITCFYGQPSIVSPGLRLSFNSISVFICYITIALVCFITCFYGQPSIVSPG